MTITETAASIFLLPPPILIGLVVAQCFAVVGVVGLVIFRLLDLPPTRSPQPPFHVAITSVFALMLSFTASDAWRRGDAAYAALLREVGEIGGLLQVADALQSTPGEAAPAEALRTEVKAYLDASLTEEWARHNVNSSAAADAGLSKARLLVLSRLAATSNPVWRVAYDRIEGMHQARTARLVAGGLFGDMLRWGGLLALFAAGAVGIAFVHLERRGAGWVALLLFATAGAIALSMVAVTEHPYAGWDATEPDRLVAIRAGLN